MKKRLQELNIKPIELPNGYYIRKLDSETRFFDITDQTIYTFTDVMLLFIGEEGADTNRIYSTTKKEEFVEHLYSNFGG